MKRLLIVPALVCLAGCGKGGAVSGPSPVSQETTPPASNVEPLPANRIFGYYAYGDADVPTYGGWTNWVLLYTTNVGRSREVAEDCRRARVQVTWTPFLGEATSRNWDATWESNKALIRPFADAGVLHSVYVADEPMAAGWGDYAEVTRRVALVHAEGWRAWYTEEQSGLDSPHPPVDYYGMDCYGDPDYCEARLIAHPEVNVYVAYAFRSVIGLPRCGPWPAKLPDQRRQAEIAHRARVGIAWWTWISWPGSGDCAYEGIGDNPEAQSIHRQLFAEWGGK